MLEFHLFNEEYDYREFDDMKSSFQIISITNFEERLDKAKPVEWKFFITEWRFQSWGSKKDKWRVHMRNRQILWKIGVVGGVGVVLRTNQIQEFFIVMINWVVP